MARMVAEDMRSNNNQMASVNWRWRKNGDVTEIPRAKNATAGDSYNALSSDRYVEAADYLRFQYMQLGYSVDAKHLKKFGLSNMTINFSANNLFLWTKIFRRRTRTRFRWLQPCYRQSADTKLTFIYIQLEFWFLTTIAYS